MDIPAEQPPFAWQPLTPKGVAAFARATWGRLLGVQLVVALFAAGSVVWFVQARWFSVVARAIKVLPTQSEIRGGKLQWPGEPTQTLAENSFLSLCIDLKHEGIARSPAHVQVEFGQNNVRVISLFGSWQSAYLRGWQVALNQPALEPWWGAWSPALLALIAIGMVAGLIALWTTLAFVYAPVAWLVCFFSDRRLSFHGSWRLAGAALMPGALFLSACLCVYGLGVLDLLRLIAAAAVHFLLGWVYLVYGALRVPRQPSAQSAQPNPFVGPEVAVAENQPVNSQLRAED